MAEDLTRKMLAAAAWERAKGALRELVVIQGHKRLTAPARSLTEEMVSRGGWELLDERVKAFIESIEDDELHT